MRFNVSFLAYHKNDLVTMNTLLYLLSIDCDST